MIHAKPEDKELIMEILTRSFKDNRSVNYIVRQDHKKLFRIRALMEYSFDLCYLFGDVWLSDDRQACALVLYPANKRTNLRTLFMHILLLVRAIGLKGLKKTLEREKQINRIRPKKKMAYLWFIGVDPDKQRLGIGGRFLRQLLNEANKERLPVFLETSTLKNLPWYERFGFQTYNKLNLGYDLFFLKWVPSK